MIATRIISPRVSPNSTAPYYHGGVVHVRTDGGASARSCEPGELASEGGSIAVTAETLISRTGEGPWAPIAVALERDAPLRDVMVKGIAIPSLMGWARTRIVIIVAAAVPFVMLLELDRELVAKDLLGVGRFLVDLLLAAYVGFELTRRSPRMPAVAGAAMLAMAMRWVLVATRLCGRGVHPAVWAAAALSIGGAIAIFGRAPSRGRMALELFGKLGISRSDANAVKAKAITAPSSTLVVAAIAGAAGLPILLWVLRRSGVGTWPQAAAFVVYGALVPWVVLRLERDPDGRLARPEATARAALPLSARLRRASREGSARFALGATVVSTLFAIALGLTLTASLLYGTHQFFDAGGELARCADRLDVASRRLLAAEALELSRRIASVRASTMLVLMTTAVMPLAEERIYRGLLMNVLVKKYGFAYGLFVSAAVFGFAHVGIYELALYQTVLLGIGFGIAYAEGGIVAAFVVHAVWNLLNVA
jgi:membrane protease YdiL (CAAX protease family)